MTEQPDLLRALLTEAYNDLANSVQIINRDLPALDLVLRQTFTALDQDWLMITKVNSERQVEELLDDEGQLRLRTPLNVFIGGQILDRGVTIANLIGFFLRQAAADLPARHGLATFQNVRFPAA